MVKKFEPTEKQIQDSIMNYLLINRYYVWRNNTGATHYENSKGRKRMVRYGKPGSSDIIGLTKDGKFLAIEVKRPNGKTTKLQEMFLQNINANGGVGFVATSIDDVINKGL